MAKAKSKFSGKSAFAGKKTGGKAKKSTSRASTGRRGNAWAAYVGGKSSEDPF